MIPFLKMQGCGNDFIMIDDEGGRLSWDDLSRLARKYCPRRFGVGADGLIAIGHGPLTGEQWPDGADYEMRYINADGSRAEMCGNGIRCLGKFVADELGEERETLNIATGAGLLSVRLIHDVGGPVHSVAVNMGVPGLTAGEIPTTLRPVADQLVSVLLEVNDDRVALTGVNMGNPHAVIFVDSITEHHVEVLGPMISTHPVFPNGVNVEFVQVISENKLRMRVWERGVGETWACGTGACASFVAAVLNGHCKPGNETTLALNGGDLMIHWLGEGRPVRMTGPAKIVYAGKLDG